MEMAQYGINQKGRKGKREFGMGLALASNELHQRTQYAETVLPMLKVQSVIHLELHQM